MDQFSIERLRDKEILNETYNNFTHVSTSTQPLSHWKSFLIVQHLITQILSNNSYMIKFESLNESIIWLRDSLFDILMDQMSESIRCISFRLFVSCSNFWIDRTFSSEFPIIILRGCVFGSEWALNGRTSESVGGFNVFGSTAERNHLWIG